VSRKRATSSEALRTSRIIACPPRRSRGHADAFVRRAAGSWLTYRVVVVPIPGTGGPDPSPSALGRVIGPRPSRSAVEPLLGTPRCCAVDLVVAAPKHAAFVVPLPMPLNGPRIRVEVVPNNRPANARLNEARPHGVLETRVARRKCVSHARSMCTSSQHERRHDGHGLYHVRSLALARFTLTRSCEEFRHLLRTGQDPDAPGKLLQVMPWPVYGKITDLDLRAIYEFLSAIPSLPNNPNPGP